MKIYVFSHQYWDSLNYFHTLLFFIIDDMCHYQQTFSTQDRVYGAKQKEAMYI